MGVVTLICAFGVWCFGDGACESQARGGLTVTPVYGPGALFAEMDYGPDPWPMVMLQPAPGIGGPSPRVFFGGDGFIQSPTMVTLNDDSGEGWISMHNRTGVGPGRPAMAEGICTATEGRAG